MTAVSSQPTPRPSPGPGTGQPGPGLPGVGGAGQPPGSAPGAGAAGGPAGVTAGLNQAAGHAQPGAGQTAGRGLLRRGRQHAAGSTPARLQAQLVRIVAVAALTGALVAVVASSRHAVTQRITDNVEPVIVAARQVKVDLARADAAAANAFLAGGLENADQRARYEESLRAATAALEEASRRSGDDPAAHSEIQAMAAQVPVYAGLIETARANNRQNLPVGAGYLNAASAVLKADLYPAADRLTQRALDRYRDDYNSQVGLGLALVVVSLAGAALLVLLLVRSQLFIRARFRRSLNPPLLGATVAGLALLLWMLFGFASQVGNLRTARVEGYAGVRSYLDVRAAAFTAKSDESLYLIARGNGGAFEDDFQAQSAYILSPTGDGTGLLERARADASSPAEDVAATKVATLWQSYRDSHATIVTSDKAGRREDAVAAATGSANAAFDTFEAATRAGLEADQAEFESAMGKAARVISRLSLGGALLAGAAVVLAIWGAQARMREYR